MILADTLEPPARARFLAIASDPDAAEGEALNFAAILAPLLAGKEDDIAPGGPGASPRDLLEAWQSASVPGEAPGLPRGGFIDDDVPADGGRAPRSGRLESAFADP